MKEFIPELYYNLNYSCLDSTSFKSSRGHRLERAHLLVAKYGYDDIKYMELSAWTNELFPLLKFFYTKFNDLIVYLELCEKKEASVGTIVHYMIAV